MFKICYLKVNYEDQSIEPSLFQFGDSVYIFGPNNVGKTIMLQAIDFVLGKSNFIIKDKDGLENIRSSATIRKGWKNLRNILKKIYRLEHFLLSTFWTKKGLVI